MYEVWEAKIIKHHLSTNFSHWMCVCVCVCVGGGGGGYTIVAVLYHYIVYFTIAWMQLYWPISIKNHNSSLYNYIKMPAYVKVTKVGYFSKLLYLIFGSWLQRAAQMF